MLDRAAEDAKVYRQSLVKTQQDIDRDQRIIPEHLRMKWTDQISKGSIKPGKSWAKAGVENSIAARVEWLLTNGYAPTLFWHSHPWHPKRNARGWGRGGPNPSTGDLRQAKEHLSLKNAFIKAANALGTEGANALAKFAQADEMIVWRGYYIFYSKERDYRIIIPKRYFN